MDTYLAIVIGIVCLALGAFGASLMAKSQRNTKVRDAVQQISDAEDKAKEIHAEALRQAETTKKEALIEAKEEILRLKQESEDEAEQRKGELRSRESRIMQLSLIHISEPTRRS